LSSVMSEPVRVYIERVKAALGVTTDEEMGNRLGLSKQTIASWRRRNKIPLEVEARLVSAFGPDFAYSDLTKEITTLRENEVVFASALYAYSRFERRLDRRLTLSERVSLGYLFKEVEKLLRAKVRQIGFEFENSESLLEILIALIDAGKIESLEETLERSLEQEGRR
jgi:hypothetical protein